MAGMGKLSHTEFMTPVPVIVITGRNTVLVVNKSVEFPSGCNS